MTINETRSKEFLIGIKSTTDEIKVGINCRKCGKRTMWPGKISNFDDLRGILSTMKEKENQLECPNCKTKELDLLLSK